MESAVNAGVADVPYQGATGSSGESEEEEAEEDEEKTTEAKTTEANDAEEDAAAEKDEGEEEEAEDDGTQWNVDYSVETGRAYRTNILDKRNLKEYTADFSCKEGATALDVIIATWPDSYTAAIPQRTCGEQWPEKFKAETAATGKPLPKNGKRKKKASDNLWHERTGRRIRC